VREARNFTTFMYRMSLKSGRLNLQEHSGPHRACFGTPSPLLFGKRNVIIRSSITWLDHCTGYTSLYRVSINVITNTVNPRYNTTLTSPMNVPKLKFPTILTLLTLDIAPPLLAAIRHRLPCHKYAFQHSVRRSVHK